MRRCSVKGCEEIASLYNADGEPLCSEHKLRDNGLIILKPRCNDAAQVSLATDKIYRAMIEFTNEEEGGLTAIGWFRALGNIMERIWLDSHNGALARRKNPLNER